MVKKNKLFLVSGFLIWLTVILSYAINGYGPGLLFFWLSSLSLIILGFPGKAGGFVLDEQIRFSKKDLYATALLLFIFTPVYLAFIYYIPYQINTDEPAIMLVAKTFSNRLHTDLFGLTHYFNFPALIFIIFGKIANVLGGINLMNFRLVHALSALLIIIFSYFFFRLAAYQIMKGQTLMSSLYPLAGAIIVGSNHSLIAISRMALRDNSALLVEIIALTILFLGLIKKNVFIIFFGSLFIGLSFYVYLPARITIFLWFALLVWLIILFREKYRFLEIIKIGLITLFGTILMTTPLILSSLKSADTEFSYIKNRLLLFKTAQEEQRNWVGARTIEEGLTTNTIQGLMTFNKKIHDHNYIYPNYGHGFVDPLTGILIWVGLLSVIIQLSKRDERKEIHVLAAGSFLIIWLVLSFFFDKNPHYNRLLLVLPFTSFLTIEGLRTLGTIFETLAVRLTPFARFLGSFVLVGGVLVIFLWNVNIFGDFVRAGLKNDSLGGTARYQELRKNVPHYSFYVASSQHYPYYSWGEAWNWNGWLNFFSQEGHSSKIISPDNVIAEIGSPPLTIFMNSELWKRWQHELISLYPSLIVFNITSDGSRLAIEIINR